jgi:hypothetical protein
MRRLGPGDIPRRRRKRRPRARPFPSARRPIRGDASLAMRSSSVARISLQDPPELLDRQRPVESAPRVFLGDVNERQTGSHS